MSSLLQCVSVMIYISVSPISSELTCEYYSQDLPVSLFDHVAGYSSSANSTYIMGGKASDGGSGQRTVYKRNLSSDAEASFKPIAEIPDLSWESNGVQTMFPVENILYVIGVSGAAHTVNKFDTISNQWLVNGAEPPTQLELGCIAYNDSHFVMIDGWADNHAPVVYIQFYDIVRDMWTQHTVEPPFNTTGLDVRWRYQYCALVDDKLYIFGGKIGETIYGGSSSMYLDGMWRYDMLNQQFTRIGTLPRPCAYGTTAVDGFGHMYLLGCYDGADDVRDHYTNEILVFDSSAESIVPDAIISLISISETAAVVLNQALWIFGGSNEDTAVVSDKIQICDISSFFGTTKEPSTDIYISREPSATPSSAMPSSAVDKNAERDLVLSIIVVFAALACFCGAIFYLRSQNKHNDQQAQDPHPKNEIVSVASRPMHMHQPAINNLHQQHPYALPHYVANVTAVHHQPGGAQVHPQNNPHQSPPNLFSAIVQSNIVHDADDEKITEEGHADEQSQSSQTRASDSSDAMHEDHWAVYKVTNFNGVEDAEKLEIFEKDKQKEQNVEHIVNRPDTKGENRDF